jgi:hypothetical protein
MNILNEMIKNDYYDDIFYFINGESLNDNDLNGIKNGEYELLNELICENENTERYKVFHIKNYKETHIIEIWIRKSKYTQIIRDIKIKQLLC